MPRSRHREQYSTSTSTKPPKHLHETCTTMKTSLQRIPSNPSVTNDAAAAVGGPHRSRRSHGGRRLH